MKSVNNLKTIIYNFVYRILFVGYLKLRPNKKESLYLKEEELFLTSRVLLMLLIVAVILLYWNALVGIIGIAIIGFIFLNWLLEPHNFNLIIGNGLIQYLNYRLNTNGFNNRSNKSKNCLTYYDNIVILDKGFYGEDKTEYLITFNQSGRMQDHLLYVEIGSYKNDDLMNNDIYRMNKINMMGLDNDDLEIMITKLNIWLFEQNPAKAILKKIE